MRVRVTSSRRGAAKAPGRAASDDLVEQTELGSVYLGGLMRAQLRLSLTVLTLMAVGLAALPVVLWLAPAARDLRLGGIPIAWLVLGVAVYPVAWLLSRWYTRSAERIERDFSEVVERP